MDLSEFSKEPAVRGYLEKDRFISDMDSIVFSSKRNKQIGLSFITKGGPGSGNYGHAGRPGEVGGSAGGGAGSAGMGGSTSSSVNPNRSLIPGQEIKLAKVNTEEYDYSNGGRTELGDKNYGKCFDTSGRFALNNYEEGNVVHGSITLHGVKIAHAWVELPGDVVFDGTQTQFFDKNDYYKVTGAVKQHEYTFDEARTKMLSQGHFGPWEVISGMLKDGGRGKKSIDTDKVIEERLSEAGVKLSKEELAMLRDKSPKRKIFLQSEMKGCITNQTKEDRGVR